MFGRTRRQRRERALNRLISRMNDPGRWNPLEGWKTRADRAYRMAERLDDPADLPILRQIILAHADEPEWRDSAYFIMSRLLSKYPVPEEIAFYIERIGAETDETIRFRMLVHLGRIRVPETQPMEAIIEMTNAMDAQVREAAMYAMGSQQSKACRNVLRRVIAQADHQTQQGDLLTAQSALRKNGLACDLSLLEKNLHSQSRRVRESAQGVMEEIRKRCREFNFKE